MSWVLRFTQELCWIVGIVWRRTMCLKSFGVFAVVVVVTIQLGGCNERLPQYQIIPAIMDDDREKLEVLLTDSNVNINWKAGGVSESALSTAAGFNRIAIAQLLLRRGADPNIETSENNTPLQAAAYRGYTQMVRLLVDAGANVNVAETRYGYSPLMLAASKGHADIVKLLLDAGADRNATTKDSRSASTLAQQQGNAELAQLLIFYQPSGDRLENPMDISNSQ